MFEQQENKKIEDYRSVGVTSNILEHNVPQFTWNIDEHQIITDFGLKPGNRIKHMISYSELSEDLINDMNNSYGIVILPYHESIILSEREDYRFVIVE